MTITKRVIAGLLLASVSSAAFAQAIIYPPNSTSGGSNGAAQSGNGNGGFTGSPYVTLGSTSSTSLVDTGTVTIGTGPFSTNTPNGSELYLLTVSNPATSNGHGLTVADTYTPTTAGLAYASINNYTTFNGSVNNDHFNGFQDAGTLASTGTTNIYGSFVSTFNVQNGTLTTANGFTCGDVNLSAGGAVTNHACFTAGVISAATNNYFLYSTSTLLPSLHQGPFYLGGVLTGAAGQVTGNAYLSFPTGQTYVKLGGTQPFSWGTSITTADVIIGDQGTTGSSFFIVTPGYNSAFASGLGVYGTYTAPISTINIAAVGTKSGGGFGSNLALSTTNGATQNAPAILINASNNVGIGTQTPAALLDVYGGSISMSKLAAAPSTAPGAGRCFTYWVAGTTSGSGKLQAMCGTSTTPVTVVDNVGSGF